MDSCIGSLESFFVLDFRKMKQREILAFYVCFAALIAGLVVGELKFFSKKNEWEQPHEGVSQIQGFGGWGNGPISIVSSATVASQIVFSHPLEDFDN